MKTFLSVSKILSFPVAAWLILSATFAADGIWKFEIDKSGDEPSISYYENDKAVFVVGCGRAFGLHVAFPASAKKAGAKATITIANAKARMTFRGMIDD